MERFFFFLRTVNTALPFSLKLFYTYVYTYRHIIYDILLWKDAGIKYNEDTTVNIKTRLSSFFFSYRDMLVCI